MKYVSKKVKIFLLKSVELRKLLYSSIMCTLSGRTEIYMFLIDIFTSFQNVIFVLPGIQYFFTVNHLINGQLSLYGSYVNITLHP
jgi:hypothetical protein